MDLFWKNENIDSDLLDTTIKSEPEEDKPFPDEIIELLTTVPNKWLCTICSRSFSEQRSLNQHQDTHCDTRNHKCTDCGKAFRQSSTLLQHSVIHSVKRPYNCEICTKSFNRVSTLISHRKIHSSEKPFQCNFCDKSFHQKGNLRNHIYIHTNERPYRCQYCKKGFNQMSNLMCHKEKKHSADLVPVWACTRCDAKFQKRTLLRAHEIDKHQVKETMSSSKKLFVSKSSYATFATPTFRSSMAKKSTSAKTLLTSSPSIKTEPTASTGILIPAIRTDAWKTAHQKGDIPFAILNIRQVLPLLVRVYDCDNGQSLLRTATQADFQECRKDESRASVPVVASVTQVFEADGTTFSWSVQPPKEIYKFQEENKNLKLQYCTTVNGSSSSESTSWAPLRAAFVNEHISSSYPSSSATHGSTAVTANPQSGTSTPQAQHAYHSVPEFENITGVEGTEALTGLATAFSPDDIKVWYKLKKLKN